MLQSSKRIKKYYSNRITIQHSWIDHNALFVYIISSPLWEDYKDSNLSTQLTAIHHHLSRLENPIDKSVSRHLNAWYT